MEGMPAVRMPERGVSCELCIDISLRLGLVTTTDSMYVFTGTKEHSAAREVLTTVYKDTQNATSQTISHGEHIGVGMVTRMFQLEKNDW